MDATHPITLLFFAAFLALTGLAGANAARRLQSKLRPLLRRAR